MAVDPINGKNVPGNDYLQKNSQKPSDGKSISKDQMSPQATTNNTKSGSVNPVPTSMNPAEQYNKTKNQAPVNPNVDSLDLSAQAKNAYNNKTLTNNEIKKESKNAADTSIKTPKDNYSSQEGKIYKK